MAQLFLLTVIFGWEEVDVAHTTRNSNLYRKEKAYFLLLCPRCRIGFPIKK
jgi:hypothetical protein